MPAKKMTGIFPGRIGLGTWKMGESAAQRKREIDAISTALDIGYRLIDSAELYANGGAEEAVGAAIGRFGGARRELCIVTKVLPQNASYKRTIKACEASLKRLKSEYIDVYLLHWRGSHPFEETLRAFVELRQRGLIHRYGVSNFDVDDLEEWQEVERNMGTEETVCANQVYYSVASRGIEFDLLPWQAEHGIETMAYSPLGLGELARHPVLAELGAARGLSAAQIALAWVVRHPGVVAIPKSADRTRLEENLHAADVTLSDDELSRLDAVFPPPRRKRELETI